jgi:redox-sensitive bicupin YhaK (pirin superfamily)
VANPKKVLGIYDSASQHWVGDGFPVRNLFPSNPLWEQVSPFLMLDYAGPTRFEPSAARRGVGEHPHRGFETVTLQYQGEVEHRDSAGHAGKIGPGDVQWMTAASGVVHEEKHSEKFSRSGGLFQLVQLWVNLPKKHKMTKPRYQELTAAKIPVVTLPGSAGTLRVVAGRFGETQGPAQTFSPVELFDAQLKAGGTAELALLEGHNACVLVLGGKLRVAGAPKAAEDAQLVVLSAAGESIRVEAEDDSLILVLGGEPILEPIAAHGPFVMNTKEEVIQAVMDYQAGKMGRLS